MLILIYYYNLPIFNEIGRFFFLDVEKYIFIFIAIIILIINIIYLYSKKEMGY